MKVKSTIILCLTLLCFGQVAKGQEEIKVNQNYYYKVDLGSRTKEHLKLFDKNTKSNKGLDNNFEIVAKQKVKITEVTEDGVYFKFIKDKRIDSTDIRDNDGLKIYYLEEKQFRKLTGHYYNVIRGFRYGAYTIPIRLRKSSGNFEFDNDLFLGTNVIMRLGVRSEEHLYADLSLGVGLTKVGLNADNSLLGTVGTDFENTEVLSPTAFTFTTGLLLNFAKNVNAGVYVGWDWLSSADNRADWIHQGEPWLGIGINIVFTGEANKSSAKGK